MSTTVTTISQVRQPFPAPTPSRAGTIVKHAAIGGVIGAAAGIGLSFIGPLPIIGGMFAPLAAAIGGAAGIVVGGLVGLLRSRGAGDGAHGGARAIGTPPPPPFGGAGSVPQPPPPLPV